MFVGGGWFIGVGVICRAGLVFQLSGNTRKIPEPGIEILEFIPENTHYLKIILTISSINLKICRKV